MEHGKPAYSAAIDGLRAVAVLSVVAYHAGIPVPAGFVGVDVFFVISGYLITRILRDEIQRTGRISFLGFYARRARRILPALTVVIAATLLASVFLLSRETVAEAGNAAAAAFLFAANVFFANGPTGYFDSDGGGNPLLHLWSLGVEEQFYLAWPLVLLMARKRPLAAMFGIAALSFVTCEWLILAGHEQAAFYQAPARAWELAAGGMLAYSRFPFPRWAGWVGLLFLAVALAVPIDHFPGAGALPAVIGSVLLIGSIHAGHRCAPLEIRPMVWIGLISYSLYLWHWPVIVLGERFPMHWRIAAGFALAVLSYRYVETPFRRGFAFQPFKLVAAAALIVVAGAGMASTLGPMRLGVPPYPASNAPSIYKMGCDDWIHSADVAPCTFGPDDAPHKAVIIGDSVALQWFDPVYKLYSTPGWQLIAMTKAACPMVKASYRYERIGRVYTECDQWRAGVLRKVAEIRPNVVIFSSANDYPFSQVQWINGTREVAAALAANAKQVRMIRSTPIVAPSGTEAFDNVASWEQEAIRDIPNVAYVDMNDIVCPQGFCATVSAGGVMFRDRRHLHWNYAATLSPTLAQRMGLNPTQ